MTLLPARPFAPALLGLLLWAPGGPLRAQAPAPPITLRVLTYNIHHGVGRDGELDLARIAAVMKGAAPDVVALQEVDRGTARVDGVDELLELAMRMGMHGEFGRAMDYQGGAYGVAVLSRWPIAAVESRALPHPADHEPRTALTARIRIGEGGPWVRVTSTHLDETRDTDVRLGQAQELVRWLAEQPAEPAVLAGDFNARLDTDVMRLLDGAWTNAVAEYPQPPAPSPAPGPGGRPGPRRGGPRGDFVLFRPAGAWRIVESRAIDDFVASDHRPVLTVLEWRDPG